MNKVIGFYCSSLSHGGLEINLAKLAVWLQQRQNRVLFFLPAKAPYKKLLAENEVSMVFIKPQKKYLPFVKAFHFGKSLKKHQIESVIFRDNRDFDLMAITKKLFYSKLKPIYWQAMQLGINKTDFYHSFKFNQLQYWVTTLQGMQADVLAKTRLKPEKLKTIPLGLDLEKFTKSTLNQAACRKFFNLPETGYFIGCMGRFDAQKGQIFLVEALAKINNPNVYLVMFGEPTAGEGLVYFEKLKNLVSQLHLTERVIFRGFTDKPWLFYKAIDLFVMASDAETFGTVTIEAMATGIPVLGTNSGGTPEILDNGRLGWLYHPHKITDFMQNFEEIKHDANLVKLKTELAKQNAVNQYSSFSIALQFEQLLGID